MQELAKVFLLMLAAVIWAGAASATSMDVTIIGTTNGPSSVVPSDSVTVEVSLDSGVEAQKINNYFMTISWTAALSLTSSASGSQWLPNFGYTEYWAHLSGNLAVDAYGLELNGYDPGGKANYQVFNNQVLGTLIFHVIAPGEALVTPYYGLGDIIGDETYTAIPGVELNGVVLNNVIPEPTTILLIGLGMTGIAYSRRRR